MYLDLQCDLLCFSTYCFETASITTFGTLFFVMFCRTPRVCLGLFSSRLSAARSFPAQPISTRKAQSGRKAHKPLRTSWISQTNVSVMFENQKILCFDYRKTFLPVLVALRFMLRSRELHVLRAQRIIGFYLITHKPTRTENPIAWKLKHNCTLSAT